MGRADSSLSSLHRRRAWPSAVGRRPSASRRNADARIDRVPVSRGFGPGDCANAMHLRSLANNPRRLAAYNALHMTLFPISIMTLFWKHHIGMSMTEILMLQGFFGFVMAAFEFPSGYIADRIGYRKTLVGASALAVCGWTTYAFADSIALVVLAEAILGVSVSMVSGADTALLYESLHETAREGEFATWSGRVRFWGQTGEGTAALVAGLLFVAWAPLPFVVQAAVACVNVTVALGLVEPARHTPQTKNHLAQIKYMLRFMFVEKRHLTAVVALAIVLGMSSFVPVWLVPLYATDAGVSAEWIGPIWAVANYTVALGSLYSARIARTLGLLPTLAACIGFVAAGYAGLALTYGAFGFAWYFCLTSMRGVFGPALLHQENRLIPSSDRAGFISLRSLTFRLLFLVIAPVVGIGVDTNGQHPTLAALGVAFALLASLAWLWLRHHQRRAR